MKRILLFVSLLFVLLVPMERWGQVHAAIVSAETFLHQETTFHDDEEIQTKSADDSTAIIASARTHPLSAQRHLSTRSHLRLFSHLLLVRNILKVLSQHLTTLTQQVTRTYTTLRIPCWQYAVDNYVYAYRHIIL